MQPRDAVILEIFQRWRRGENPTAAEYQQLLAEELADPERARAFEIAEDKGLEQVEARTAYTKCVED